MEKKNYLDEIKEAWEYIDKMELNDGKKKFIKAHPFMWPNNWRDLFLKKKD